MKSFYGIIVIIIVFCLALVIFLGWIEDKKSNFRTGCFREDCFLIEIADTPQERAEGLMFRNNLPDDKGMLFVFHETGVYNFWMKNTFVPLDMIWLNQDQEVVFIKENAQPCQENDCLKIEPGVMAKYVLEIKGGRTEEIGLKIGDKFSFEF